MSFEAKAAVLYNFLGEMETLSRYFPKMKAPYGGLSTENRVIENLNNMRRAAFFDSETTRKAIHIEGHQLSFWIDDHTEVAKNSYMAVKLDEDMFAVKVHGNGNAENDDVLLSVVSFETKLMNTAFLSVDVTGHTTQDMADRIIESYLGFPATMSETTANGVTQFLIELENLEDDLIHFIGEKKLKVRKVVRQYDTYCSVELAGEKPKWFILEDRKNSLHYTMFYRTSWEVGSELAANLLRDTEVLFPLSHKGRRKG